MYLKNMQLCFSRLGVSVEIISIVLEGAARRRLEDLGISIGSAVTPISENAGNLIIKIGESRVAINRALASKILVK